MKRQTDHQRLQILLQLFIKCRKNQLHMKEPGFNGHTNINMGLLTAIALIPRITITKELVQSEKVHIVAYDNNEKNRIITLLNDAGISLSNIDFKIYQTDDFWVRDNGPIYVKDNNGKLFIQDWGFNGWGKRLSIAIVMLFLPKSLQIITSRKLTSTR